MGATRRGSVPGDDSNVEKEKTGQSSRAITTNTTWPPTYEETDVGGSQEEADALATEESPTKKAKRKECEDTPGPPLTLRPKTNKAIIPETRVESVAESGV